MSGMTVHAPMRNSAVRFSQFAFVWLVILIAPSSLIAQESPPLPPFNLRSARLYLDLVFEDAVRASVQRSRIVIHAELAPGTSGGQPRVVTDSGLHILGKTLLPRIRTYDKALVYDTVLYVPAAEFDRPLQLDLPDVAGLTTPTMPEWRAPAKLDADVVQAAPSMIRLRLRGFDSITSPDPVNERTSWGASAEATDTVYITGDGDAPSNIDVPLALLPRRGPTVKVNFDWSRVRFEQPQPDNTYTIIPRMSAALRWTALVGPGQ
jgi:hypothetical protein